MKVAEKVADTGATNRGTKTSGAQRFDEALRKARRGAPAPGRPGAGATASPASDLPARALGTRRATSERASGVLRERREIFGDAERQAQPPALPMTPQPAARAEGASELRAIVRTLPVAIEAARVREGEPLSLALGRALSVDLRRGATGLEIVLRPDAALQRAAAAELPVLLESLRARGIAVARAEVRSQPNGDPAARRPAR
jgi:hypothetical protein